MRRAGAPRRLFAIDFDLALQDALHSLFYCLTAPLASAVVYKRIEVVTVSNGRQQAQHTDHGVVIERDMSMVAAGLGIKLRPATVFVLGRQREIQSFDERLLVSVIARGLVDLRKMPHLGVRGPVVERRVVPTLLRQNRFSFFHARMIRSIVILRPSPVVSLVEKHDLGHPQIILAATAGRGDACRDHQSPNDQQDRLPALIWKLVAHSMFSVFGVSWRVPLNSITYWKWSADQVTMIRIRPGCSEGIERYRAKVLSWMQASLAGWLFSSLSYRPSSFVLRTSYFVLPFHSVDILFRRVD